MENNGLKAMKRYSIIHLIISVVVMVVLNVLLKSIDAMLFVYLLVSIFIPKIVEVISEIGFHETDRYVYWIEGSRYVEYGNFTEYFGPVSALISLVFYVVGCSIPLLIMYLTLPQSIYLPVTIFAGFFVIYRFLIHPLVKDIIWILSKNNPSDFLDCLYNIITVGIIIIGVITTVCVAGFTAKNAKDRLDINVALEQYFEQNNQVNPYRDMDMSDAEADFSKLSTKAKLFFDQQIVSDTGIAYPGSEIGFTYSIITNEWEISSHYFTGNMIIVSDAVYIGENELEIGGYSGLAQIEITVSSKTDEGGYGVFKILDKSTGTEVYASSFTFDGYPSGNEYVANIYFEKSLDLGPWEVNEEDIKWMSNEHIYFYMNTRDFDLYLQE